MATLGEAFIAVKADMSPFRRGLKNEAQAVADDLEAGISAAVEDAVSKGAEKGGEKGGKKAGDKISDGIKKKLGDSKGVPWRYLADALGSALDDGISALPSEIKAIIVVALLAVAPIIIASLAGAIGAGVTAGVAVLGVVLASQFESVKSQWMRFSDFARDSLVRAAAPFEGAIIEALNAAETRLKEWAPVLTDIFMSAAPLLETIVVGLLDGVGLFLDSLNRGLKNAEPFADALGDALAVVADAAGQALEIILSTGEDGTKAFRDLVFVLADLLVFAAKVIAFFAEAYAWVRKLTEATPDWLLTLMPAALLMKGLAKETDAANNATMEYERTNQVFTTSMFGVIGATKEQEKTLKELSKAIKDAQDAAFDAIETNIRWKESTDELREGFERFGGTIDVETKEGRANLRNLVDSIKAAQAEAERRYKSGELNAEQARNLYQEELGLIYDIARAYGITKEQIDTAMGAALQFAAVPPPDLTWVQRMKDGIGASLRDMQRLREIWNLGTRQGGNQPALADGGIVRAPTNALIGEAGAEVVIPMTRPARAMQLLEQSGLSRMLTPSGNVSVSVYLGNEAFDQHVQKIVVQDNRMQSRQLTLGAR